MLNTAGKVGFPKTWLHDHTDGSLQKVQGHRAGVNADLTPSTGGPVEHASR